MTALSPADPAAPGCTASDAAVVAAADHRRQRHDGWTPDRQRIFLEAIADGHAVEPACRLAGMSPSSAYAFRRRAAGAAFNLGWRAAGLLAREHIADALLARAINGQVETITRPNGDVIERHRFDNRLANTMLARLDRMAEASDSGSAAANASARLVAQEFDGFLDLIERDAGPARAGLFVATRDPALLDTSIDADLSPILSLARADRYLRAGVGGAGEVDTADLDPDARGGWTADQWTRAEAAGLVRLAPPDLRTDSASASPLSPLHPADDDEREGEDDDDGDDYDAAEGDDPVWYDEVDECWYTGFPPPDDFHGYERGDYGDPDYLRALSDAEEAVVEPARRARQQADWRADRRLRDAWFASRAAAGWYDIDDDEGEEALDAAGGNDRDGRQPDPADPASTGDGTEAASSAGQGPVTPAAPACTAPPACAFAPSLSPGSAAAVPPVPFGVASPPPGVTPAIRATNGAPVC